MTNIEIYTFDWCPYCVNAKKIFDDNGIKYLNYDASNKKIRDEMIKRSGRNTVPQIFINDEHIGGYDDLVIYKNKGGLKRLSRS